MVVDVVVDVVDEVVLDVVELEVELEVLELVVVQVKPVSIIPKFAIVLLS